MKFVLFLFVNLHLTLFYVFAYFMNAAFYVIFFFPFFVLLNQLNVYSLRIALSLPFLSLVKVAVQSSE